MQMKLNIYTIVLQFMVYIAYYRETWNERQSAVFLQT